MQPMYQRSNSWMKWPAIIVILTVIVMGSGAALSDTDALNRISAHAAADNVYSQTRQDEAWFMATLPLELEKAAAEVRNYIAQLEEVQRVQRLNNDRRADAKRMLVLGGVGLLLMAGAAAILLLALLVGTKMLNTVNREEALRREMLAAATTREQVAQRPRAVPLNRPTPIDVDTPQPLSAVRAGAVRVAKRPTAAPAPVNGASPAASGAPSHNGNGRNGASVNRSHEMNGHQHNGGATRPMSDYETADTPII